MGGLSERRAHTFPESGPLARHYHSSAKPNAASSCLSAHPREQPPHNLAQPGSFRHRPGWFHYSLSPGSAWCSVCPHALYSNVYLFCLLLSFSSKLGHLLLKPLPPVATCLRPVLRVRAARPQQSPTQGATSHFPPLSHGGGEIGSGLAPARNCAPNGVAAQPSWGSQPPHPQGSKWRALGQWGWGCDSGRKPSPPPDTGWS